MDSESIRGAAAGLKLVCEISDRDFSDPVTVGEHNKLVEQVFELANVIANAIEE